MGAISVASRCALRSGLRQRGCVPPSGTRRWCPVVRRD